MSWLNKKYPQNYIIEKKYTGALIFLVWCCIFAIVYKPFEVHESRFFGLVFTMLIYFGATSLSLIASVTILKSVRYFSNKNEWNLIKELLSIIFILLVTGIVIYLIGFLIEEPAQRLNLRTFINSCAIAFLIGIIPFLFFTLSNYRYLFATDILQSYHQATHQVLTEPAEQLIRINSQLKKEDLSFYPYQFVYAESDSNYVVFYLEIDNKIQKKIIRNSITSITQQLSVFPFLMRVHRAFIVNAKKVRSRKGNTLGYSLKLLGVDNEIPVSRQNTKDFNKLLEQIYEKS